MVELILIPLVVTGGALFLWLLLYVMRALEYDSRQPVPRYSPVLDKYKALGAVMALAIIIAVAEIVAAHP